MPRPTVVAAAQLGPIARAQTRADVVVRMTALLEEAGRRGAGLVVFPELALTSFFPRWFMDDQATIDRFFEDRMPGPEVEPLFAAARRMGIGFHLGFAERVVTEAGVRRFNTAIIVDPSGAEVLRYRKVHLPGHAEHEPERPFQHLEKRYFERGDLGFPVVRAMGGVLGALICNDRRWPEAFRCLGLQGVELVAIGYNTPRHYPNAPEHDRLQDFHNHLSLQAGAYQNGTYVVAAAKAGIEEGCDLIGGSCIVAPTGEILAVAETSGDEIVSAAIDFDRCRAIKDNMFNFALHRQPDCYGPLTAG